MAKVKTNKTGTLPWKKLQRRRRGPPCLCRSLVVCCWHKLLLEAAPETRTPCHPLQSQEGRTHPDYLLSLLCSQLGRLNNKGLLLLLLVAWMRMAPTGLPVGEGVWGVVLLEELCRQGRALRFQKQVQAFCLQPGEEMWAFSYCCRDMPVFLLLHSWPIVATD